MIIFTTYINQNEREDLTSCFFKEIKEKPYTLTKKPDINKA